MSSLKKNRLKYLILSFLYKQMNNKIDCPQILENYNLKINNNNNTRNRVTFIIKNCNNNYILHSLRSSLMSACNILLI